MIRREIVLAELQVDSREQVQNSRDILNARNMLGAAPMTMRAQQLSSQVD